MENRRIFLIVLDSYGIGALPDAADFGDEGSNTLKTITASKAYDTPNMKKLGLFNIDGVDWMKKEESPAGAYGRMKERSRGKDTTIGHWEIAGVVSPKPLPVYPNGFPEEILEKFREATGREVLCNLPYSGTDVIRDYGEEHMKTGALIVYTSADSVFQIAAHEEIVPVEELYRYCEIAREILCGEHGVGRVIARPFIGEAPNFQRTANRHDFSLLPPMYGHRNDIEGYANAATVFDRQLKTFLERMRPEDILMITADHGCDPGFRGTDHSREHTPLLICGEDIKENVNLGTRETFADIAATVLDLLHVENNTDGTSMKELIIK